MADLGLKISANTLKSYSARYNWQHRAELVDGAHMAVELANVPREMDERQARLGVAMQALAREKLNDARVAAQTSSSSELTANR